MSSVDQRKKLRRFYSMLRNQERVLDDLKKIHTIDGQALLALIETLTHLEREFPNLVPVLRTKEMASGANDDGSPWYLTSAVRSHLASVLGVLDSELDDDTASPVSEVREFKFVRDAKLRRILERDYEEIQRAFVARCWKSVIILSGGAIEAILVDEITAQAAAARSAPSAPKKTDVSKWDLSELINVAADLNIGGGGLMKLSHSVREYRNLIHPGNEIRTALTFDSAEARIAIEVLHILHRHLS